MNYNSNKPSKFSMKLMLGQNAVLVEYPGMEPQLFMPVLLNHDVVFKNIVFEPKNSLAEKEPPKQDVPVRQKTAEPSRSLPNRVVSQKKKSKIISNKSERSSQIQGKKDTQQVHFEQSVPQKKETSRKVAPKVLPSRQCSISRETLKKRGITGPPPPFDVIRKLFYLDRGNYGSRGKASLCSSKLKDGPPA